jgi:acyl phosphate:glycerol-3-phosphate acyltransferase
VTYLIVTVAAYLLGSVPSGYLAGKIAGTDVRTRGSGNIGATNVLRVLGKKHGYSVFLADALKGFLPVQLALRFAGEHHPDYLFGIIAAIASVFGHSFPIWLRFRGGKGVATALGACAALLPGETVLVAALWVLTFFAFRFVSLASLAAAIALPFSVWLFGYCVGRVDLLLLAFSVLVAVLVICRHRSNIVRLLRGTEPRFNRR